ncbi:hypothetical protein LSTR_LSTR005599 [Laodelphax striatellus]|uniref:EF-hand domain-containing protein n=1 Tax=Laodelphax striatellus TaxID=195883 RepID=A0A482WXL0_LAOST|nr:hypothetical protein LSTR_LSTR005599 [Laodelphax striatellus]
MMKVAFLLCCVAGYLSTIDATGTGTVKFPWDITGSIARFRMFRTNEKDEDDHLITFEEFKQFGPKVFTTRAPKDDLEWAALYDVYDISDNLQVDIREFVICDTMHTEFLKIDKDNNGLLSKTELLSSIDIEDKDLAKDKVTFLEYYARVFTDEKLVDNWRENVGKEITPK